MPSDSKFWTGKFVALRFAIAWLIYLFMRSIVLLPFSWQLALGKRLGASAEHLLASRRRVVERNLAVCFPALSAKQRELLLTAHFEALGASFIEMAMAWFGSESTIRDLVRIEGAQHLSEALQKGRGVILYSGHFTSFEIFFPVLAPLCTRLCGMYKSQHNWMMDKMMRRGRERNFDHLFENDSVREMLRELAANSVVWYASDQSYTQKGSALIPFFNEPAMTNTAISRIAKASGATLLPYFCKRLADDSAYVMSIGPEPDDFPSDDPGIDARRLIKLLEDFILTCPEQYWWIHRRFKGRPPPHPDIYRDSDS